MYTYINNAGIMLASVHVQQIGLYSPSSFAMTYFTVSSVAMTYFTVSSVAMTYITVSSLP